MERESDQSVLGKPESITQYTGDKQWLSYVSQKDLELQALSSTLLLCALDTVWDTQYVMLNFRLIIQLGS